MLEWLAQTVGKYILGYAMRWYRSRPKVLLTTHGTSRSGRGVDMSITNHGKTSIIVRYWTVHIQMELSPELVEIFRKHEQQQSKATNTNHSLAGYISRLLDKWDRRAKANALRTALAHVMLDGPHWQYELLDPGNTQRIEPKESTARVFPRPDASSSISFMPANAARTIIPSCRIVGHRYPVWGLPSGIISDDDGSIISVIRLTQPHMDDED